MSEFIIINLEFTTDYGQFYLCDKNSAQATDSADFWTAQASADKLAVEEGILGVGIGKQYGTVKCELEILQSKNHDVNFASFDHIVEASIKIESGILQVMDCPDSLIKFETKIDVGEYRVRVYSSNLVSCYDENPNDIYRIEIWQEAFSDRIVMKRKLE
ncbi:MAG: hypothetical protein ACHQFW_07650 [Chitinophagales bacterium]